MAIAIIVGRDVHEASSFSWFTQEWKDKLLTLDPTLDIRIYPDLGNKSEIDFLLVFIPPLNIFEDFPHIKGILALAAGIDSILSAPKLFPNIPIVRLIDPYMAKDICQYAVAYVLNYVKRVEHWRSLQPQHIWGKFPPFNFSDKTVGIMGLGQLGSKIAGALTFLDLKVIGWSQSKKEIPQVQSYVGDDQFIDFLQHTDILISILPLTKSTANILNKHTFSHLKKNAYLINMGRGEALVEEDLLTALDSGQLCGATLDIFRTEPLPATHPFWDHPKIIVTPHIASVTNAQTAAPLVLENIYRIQKGQEPVGKVDLIKGY